MGKAEININHHYHRTQFSKGTPSIIYNANIPSQYNPLLTPEVGVVLLRSGAITKIDPAHVSVVFRYITITDQDTKPRVVEYLNVTKCTFSDNQPSEDAASNVLTDSASCPLEQVVMSGSYAMNTYRYLDIGVVRCTCAPNDTSCGCSSDADFKKYYYNDTAINILISEHIPSYSVFARRFNLFPPNPNFAHPPTIKNYTQSIYWYSSQYVVQKVDISIRRKSIYNAPRFIFDYGFGEFYSVGEIISRQVDASAAGNVLFKAFVRLDQYENQEFRQSPGFLQLIGSWGALWTFFSITALQLVRMYNKRMYHSSLANSAPSSPRVAGSRLPPHQHHTTNNDHHESHQQHGDIQLKSMRSSRNILHASSTSLEKFAWETSRTQPSGGLTSSYDLNDSNNHIVHSDNYLNSTDFGSSENMANNNNNNGSSSNMNNNNNLSQQFENTNVERG
ncbi:hypothetical protein SAMD00019534_052130 [Acytostelium subglobosum LB1]|uniref:hypothetical protein n=1 Tax=Acytostelium subglobosum LB1 TaxID=1410327 RepID=UPI0006449582|nr:hypothetical protein SAMD00019534_052130 [Acytostelium subglobosum LB1]GAM22038.1 hypothetical protein SAMD00019534_052130 [Acytostelium subglobosum LB1]|eukprot:XP_012755138.1 hypothetical protein SAMD00019534_052130 [Acytostelium subglobosum LB1]